MILQRDERFEDQRWRKWGCNLMTCFFYANKFENYPWTIDDMVLAARHFQQKVWIDTEFAIQRYDLIYDFLGLEVDWISSHGHYPSDYVCKPGEFEHLFWRNTHEGLTIGHFTPGNGAGMATYDPWGDSNCVKYGKVLNKRIFRRK